MIRRKVSKAQRTGTGTGTDVDVGTEPADVSQRRVGAAEDGHISDTESAPDGCSAIRWPQRIAGLEDGPVPERAHAREARLAGPAQLRMR